MQPLNRLQKIKPCVYRHQTRNHPSWFLLRPWVESAWSKNMDWRWNESLSIDSYLCQLFFWSWSQFWLRFSRLFSESKQPLLCCQHGSGWCDSKLNVDRDVEREEKKKTHIWSSPPFSQCTWMQRRCGCQCVDFWKVTIIGQRSPDLSQHLRGAFNHYHSGQTAPQP